jgi:hypothetical protein
MLVPITLTEGEDGETRRRFFLIAEVSFAVREDRADGGYYADAELVERFTGWTDAALEDRDDSPVAKFHAVPAPLDTDVAAIAAGAYPGNADALAHLNRLLAVLSTWVTADPERAASQERELFVTALRMIREGAGDPAALANAALGAVTLQTRH